MSDKINSPSHYTHGGIEVIDAIEAWDLGFCLGNTVKYVARAGKKATESKLDDLKKARWYLEREIQKLECEESEECLDASGRAMRCAVANCRYVAESSIGDFTVCALHDHGAVRAILDEGRLPGAYFMPNGCPIVLPCGELEERHLDPTGEGAMRAGDDPAFDDAPEGGGALVWKGCDLTREWVP